MTKIGHFTVVSLVTWPWIGSEAGVTLFWHKPHRFSYVNGTTVVSVWTAWSTYEKQWDLNQNKVTPSVLPIQGQDTKLCYKWAIPDLLVFPMLNQSISDRRLTSNCGTALSRVLSFQHPRSLHGANLYTKLAQCIPVPYRQGRGTY